MMLTHVHMHTHTCNAGVQCAADKRPWLQCLMMRSEADLYQPWGKFLCLGLGLLYLGKQMAIEATLEVHSPLSKSKSDHGIIYMHLLQASQLRFLRFQLTFSCTFLSYHFDMHDVANQQHAQQCNASSVLCAYSAILQILSMISAASRHITQPDSLQRAVRGRRS